MTADTDKLAIKFDQNFEKNKGLGNVCDNIV